MNKEFKDNYGNVVTIGSSVFYNLSGDVVRGKVVDILPKFVKIELTFPQQYNHWDWSSPFRGLERGHISKVRNRKSISLEKT